MMSVIFNNERSHLHLNRHPEVGCITCSRELIIQGSYSNISESTTRNSYYVLCCIIKFMSSYYFENAACCKMLEFMNEGLSS